MIPADMLSTRSYRASDFWQRMPLGRTAPGIAAAENPGAPDILVIQGRRDRARKDVYHRFPVGGGEIVAFPRRPEIAWNLALQALFTFAQMMR